MKKDTLAWTVAGLVIVILIIIAIVITAHRRAAEIPTATTTATDATSTGSTSATTNSAAPAAGTTVQPNGSTIIRTIPSNTEVNESSDLVKFSIAPGSHILSGIPATGTIDSSYVSGGQISIELADQNYKVLRTITGSVTGTAPDGNVTFSATINTSGIATGGVGYIIFQQVSGNRYVSIPVIFDK